MKVPDLSGIIAVAFSTELLALLKIPHLRTVVTNAIASRMKRSTEDHSARMPGKVYDCLMITGESCEIASCNSIIEDDDRQDPHESLSLVAQHSSIAT